MNFSVAGDTANGSVDLAILHDEIEAAGPYTDTFEGILFSGDDLEAVIANPSVGDQTTITNIVAAHQGINILEAAKTAKVVKVDGRTQELIAQGFVFSAKVFSLSANSQNTLMGMYTIKDHPAFAYPVVYNTKDDDDTLTIPDAATVEGLYLTAVGTYRAHLDSGTVIKDQIRAAGSVAAVNAIVDNR